MSSPRYCSGLGLCEVGSICTVGAGLDVVVFVLDVVVFGALVVKDLDDVAFDCWCCVDGRVVLVVGVAVVGGVVGSVTPVNRYFLFFVVFFRSRYVLC